jgi:hypothetical protein
MTIGSRRSWLLFGGLLALAGCGGGAGSGALDMARNDAGPGDGPAADTAGDSAAASGDGGGGGGGEVRLGFVCQDLCTVQLLAGCSGGPPSNCSASCEYDRAANGGCLEFDSLVRCILVAPGNPFQCINDRASLRTDVCVAEKRAFCQNPRCQLVPPAVPSCMGM